MTMTQQFQFLTQVQNQAQANGLTSAADRIGLYDTLLVAEVLAQPSDMPESAYFSRFTRMDLIHMSVGSYAYAEILEQLPRDQVPTFKPPLVYAGPQQVADQLKGIHDHCLTRFEGCGAWQLQKEALLFFACAPARYLMVQYMARGLRNGSIPSPDMQVALKQTHLTTITAASALASSASLLVVGRALGLF